MKCCGTNKGSLRPAPNVAYGQQNRMGRGFAVIFFGPMLFSSDGFDPLIAKGADTGAKQLKTKE